MKDIFFRKKINGKWRYFQILPEQSDLDWHDLLIKKPEERKPIWVFTKEKRLILAWYLVGKNSNFWPYEKIAKEAEPILDVDFWAYANYFPQVSDWEFEDLIFNRTKFNKLASFYKNSDQQQNKNEEEK